MLRMKCVPFLLGLTTAASLPLIDKVFWLPASDPDNALSDYVRTVEVRRPD
jgi:hypothetical protein